MHDHPTATSKPITHTRARRRRRPRRSDAGDGFGAPRHCRRDGRNQAAPASRRASSATTSRRGRWRCSAGSAWRSTLRDAGLPADYPNDCAYRTTTTGIELSRIPIPCRRDRYTATGGPDTDWPTAEPPHRINQIYMEPVLFAHAAAIDGLTILNRTAFEDFEENDDGIVATARDLDTDTTLTDSCRLHRRLRRRALRRPQGDRCDAAGHADHPAGAVDLYPRARSCSG